MKSEEPPEDRKLVSGKGWFSRSASSISFQNGTGDTVANRNSSCVSVSKEGVLESGPGFTSLRQLSMRRSRPSGEIEKEVGVGSSSITPKNITPLTPLTSLRWKSTPREQEEEEKAMELSRFGMPRDEENPRGKLAAAVNGKEDKAAEGQQQVAEVAAHDPTSSVVELSTKGQAGNVDDTVSLEPTQVLSRKQSAGDDVMTMTIEFLRARLISERSASKAAKLRVHQLATKVSELEQKLDQAMGDRKKAEVAAQEAVMKLKLAESSNQVLDKASGEVSDRSISNSTKDSPLLRSRVGREDTKYLQEMSSNDLSRTNSYGSSVEDRDSTTKKQLPETVSNIEGRSAEPGRLGMGPALQKMTERSQESSRRQDSRAAIESRLRNMWSKISEEMAAFAEEKSEEGFVREELMSWMGQVPSVLQDIIPKKPTIPSHSVPLSSETECTQPKLVETHPVAERSPQGLSDNGQPHAIGKGAALLHEQFTQQEWESSCRESQRMLEQLKGVDRNVNRSPRASGGRQHADRMRGLNGVADHPSSIGSPRARLAKSRSSLDLPTRHSEYNSDVSSPHRDGPYVESDSWNTGRPRGQVTNSRHRDAVYENSPAERPMPLEANHLNHSRMRQERSSEPSMLQEAGREAWSERQLDQEAGLYYQDTGNGVGLPSYAERGPSQWPPPNSSAEDGFRGSQPEVSTAQRTWGDVDRRSSGRHQQAQPGDSEREESFRSSHPETTHQVRDRHRHRHRRSHSDNDDWPAAEDYGLLDQRPEPRSGLERRQSYSGYPATTASDSSRSSFDKTSGSFGDLRYRDERMYGARELRRESFPSSKADHASGQQYATQAGRDDFSNGEPPLSLGYGPAFDAPKEGSPGQLSPKAGINKNISDILRALQMAKANIQNGSAGVKEPRSSREQAGYGMEPSGQYMQTSQQGMAAQFSQATFSKSSRSASRNGRYDPYEADSGSDRYQSEGDPTGGTSSNTSYVDQLNVGKGIQFFFP